jgi:hypothetical protein
MTRISVAHRPEMSSGAHRTLRVGDTDRMCSNYPSRFCPDPQTSVGRDIHRAPESGLLIELRGHGAEGQKSQSVLAKDQHALVRLAFRDFGLQALC